MPLCVKCRKEIDVTPFCPYCGAKQTAKKAAKSRSKMTQRADGRYQCKYKGKYFYGETQKEANDKRDAYRRLVESGLKQEAIGITLYAYAAKWVKTYKHHLQDAAYDTHVRMLRKLCEHEGLGSRPMNSIDTIDIQDFFNTVCAGKSQSYINDVRDTVRGLFKHALADRVIQHNPAVTAHPPQGESGTHRAITQEERQLIADTPNRIRPAVMLMLYAGLRRGEALALDIDRDVDFERKTIHVHEAVRFERQHLPNVVAPKTAAGVRIVPLLDVLADELRDVHGLAAKSADGGMMTMSAFRAAWASYMIALAKTLNGTEKRWYGKRNEDQGKELPPWRDVSIRSHDLRHSYCTMLYDAGIDIKTAQKWMGHKDPSVTMAIYTHISQAREKAATDTLETYAKMLSGCQNGRQNITPISQTVELQGFADSMA